MAELLGMDEPRKCIAAMLSGLDIHYDLGEGHPLLGRRMPDLDLQTADGLTRVFTLCTTPGPCSSTSVKLGGFDISTLGESSSDLVDAQHDGEWELPVLGRIHCAPGQS